MMLTALLLQVDNQDLSVFAHKSIGPVLKLSAGTAGME
jgi:hypothetical protein